MGESQLQNSLERKEGELPLRVGWEKKLLKRVDRFDNSYEDLIFLLD